MHAESRLAVQRFILWIPVQIQGLIILQKAVEVQQGDTPEVLQRRVMEEAEWKILPKAIDLIANNRVSVQNGKVVID